jgi:hypothetical protein
VLITREFPEGAWFSILIIRENIDPVEDMAAPNAIWMPFSLSR